ncbi:hypothetical protein KSS87_000562 [Heliosperma pusillum]|nr:hypothetical protein KSS87_000562 [Heliosperma pusillum]
MLTRKEKVKALLNNRWLVFVVSMWIQSVAGIGYMFGSISPIIKSSMGYNQKQVAMLGVAKDLGDSLGFIAGALSEFLPFWGILLVGVVQNFVGYGLVWLIVTGRLPALPFWVLCICIFVATNGETYFNTAALVSCVQNFPKNRGPIVGILKGFAGLSGAILSQVYHMISSTNNDSIILMVTVGPPVVVLSLMFIIRNVEGHRQARPSDAMSFTFVYGVCLLLAAYIMGVLLLEDFTELTESYMILFSVILFVILILPIIIPIILTFFDKPAYSSVEENLIMSDSQIPESSKSKHDEPEILLSEVESEIETDDEREVKGDGNLNRRKRISQLQTKLFQAAAEGAVRVRRRRGPHRGENFTLGQALVKADLWLMFVSLMLAAGTGVTIIDNLGQMCQSLGYNPRMFVSMISIWNFLGRVGGGYFSEIVVRKYSYPRPVTMAVFQVIMAIGLLYYALALPAAIYVVTVLVGLGYGAHWAIVPATVSELFGLKSFGALYNFLTMAMPVGSLVFSGVLAGRIYDYYAEQQGGHSQPGQDDDALTCTGSICFSTTCGILAGIVLIAVITSLIVVRRTRGVYSHLYANS